VTDLFHQDLLVAPAAAAVAHHDFQPMSGNWLGVASGQAPGPLKA
jgi:hypothetical protein